MDLMEKVTIFGRKGCGFCVRAKELCEIKQLDHKYIYIHEEGISKADLENGFKLTEFFIRKNLQPVKQFQFELFFRSRNRLLSHGSI